MSLSPDIELSLLEASPSAEGVRVLLSLCTESREPLEAVLDLLLRWVGARFILCADAGQGVGRRVLGRTHPGRPMARPERLFDPHLAARALAGREPLLLEPPGPGRGWRAGCALPLSSEPEAVLLAGGPDLLPPRMAALLPAFLGRAAPWVVLASRLGRLRREGGRSPGGPEPQSPAPEDARSARPSAPARAPRGPQREFPEIVALAPAMREVLRTVALIAASDAAVLIEGESGTGKELIARAIHRKSGRAAGPFVSENCSACPEGLLESEFFGVERGAFTGAHRSKPGLFERSHRGSMFLDEIGEMDFALQRKLLRVLQEREVRRVGGSQAVPVDFRLISATNRVLADEARAGRFRLDLLYRIEVVTVRLPPLRERREDIAPLLHHFLAREAASARLPLPPIHPDAMQLLIKYPWPGNVRELANEMCRAVALRLASVTPAALSAKIHDAGGYSRTRGSQPLRVGRSLEEVEKDLLGGFIRDVLEHTGGNKIRAARLLGIPKTNLYRRLRRYSIQDRGGGRREERNGSAREEEGSLPGESEFSG